MQTLYIGCFFFFFNCSHQLLIDVCNYCSSYSSVEGTGIRKEEVTCLGVRELVAGGIDL